jgi:hypothetical protein
MLFSKRLARSVAITSICASLIFQFPARAGSGVEASDSEQLTSADAVIAAVPNVARAKAAIEETISKESPAGTSGDKPVLIAQACSACGADVGSIAAVGAVSLNERKHESLLTDSLWGNLILEMAYQRDKELNKVLKRMNLLNTGILAVVSGVAGGTLAQGIVSLTTLNPADGHQDSYVPGALGVGMSMATIVAFGARMYFGHKAQQEILRRQLTIKDRVNYVMAHMERSSCSCEKAQAELKELVGERACNEWMQLWRSSHKLAALEQQRISMKAVK